MRRVLGNQENTILCALVGETHPPARAGRGCITDATQQDLLHAAFKKYFIHFNKILTLESRSKEDTALKSIIDASR